MLRLRVPGTVDLFFAGANTYNVSLTESAAATEELSTVLIAVGSVTEQAAATETETETLIAGSFGNYLIMFYP